MGQSEAVARLAAFAEDPYPAAFILAGATGTGKTSAAWALAAELGCDIDNVMPEWGGVYTIPSGEHNADALREIWPKMELIPVRSARRWKVLIVNEIEQLNGAVEKLWLDKLENIPRLTVIVFTTNALDTLPDRFVDRCIGGVIEFESDADELTEPALKLACSIWRQETGYKIPVDVANKVVKSATRGGRLSFRRVVQALVPMLAQKRG